MMDRLSQLLRQAGARGKTYKHRLMCHAAEALADVEHTLGGSRLQTRSQSSAVGRHDLVLPHVIPQ